MLIRVLVVQYSISYYQFLTKFRGRDKIFTERFFLNFIKIGCQSMQFLCATKKHFKLKSPTFSNKYFVNNW